MALLALSPFDIFTSLFFSFGFFSIGKKENSFFLLVMFVEYLSVYFHLDWNHSKSIHFLIRIFDFTSIFFFNFTFSFRTFIVNIHFVSTSLVGVSHNMYITFFLIRFGEIGRAKSMYNESLSVASYSNIIGDKSAIARKKKFWFVAEFFLKAICYKKKNRL